MEQAVEPKRDKITPLQGCFIGAGVIIIVCVIVVLGVAFIQPAPSTPATPSVTPPTDVPTSVSLWAARQSQRKKDEEDDFT